MLAKAAGAAVPARHHPLFDPFFDPWQPDGLTSGHTPPARFASGARSHHEAFLPLYAFAGASMRWR